jgi:flagellin-like protein
MKKERVSMKPVVQGRKGISPLIATVLLLAFAVAIGTMVVSYILDATKSEPCDDARVAVVDVTGAVQQTACYKDNQIKFIAKNVGDRSLAQVKIVIANANGGTEEPAPLQNLDPASQGSVSYFYQTINPAGITVTLTPVIEVNGVKDFCQAPQEITIIKLAEC